MPYEIVDPTAGRYEIVQPPKQTAGEVVKQGAGDLLGGVVRGAGSIGATLLTPIDWAARQAGIQNDYIGRTDRRQAMDEVLADAGADPSSTMFKLGKVGAEVTGTLGVGGALAAPLRALSSAPAVNALATALQTGGFRAPGLTGIPALLARVGAGGATGGVSAGLVDPETAGAGAAIGAFLPPAVQGAGAAGQLLAKGMQAGSNRLMQSAVKPTLEQLRSGDAAVATRVMLDQGINPTRGGVDRLRGLIDDTDNAIGTAIAGSNAQVDKQAVLNTLGGTRAKFMQQATPQGDLAAIQAAEDAFMAHPAYPGPTIPVQAAHDLKKGTYAVLSKKYGQLGSADTEAQKAIARGLKDEVAAAVPGISDLNAKQSDLLRALKVVERRALMESNKNPMGLASLAPTPGNLAMFMADKSALLKSLAARGMNSAAKPTGRVMGLLDNPALLPYVRGGLLASEANP